MMGRLKHEQEQCAKCPAFTRISGPIALLRLSSSAFTSGSIVLKHEHAAGGALQAHQELALTSVFIRKLPILSSELSSV